MARFPVAAVASGALLALSFPPFFTTPLPFVALVPFALQVARLPGGRDGALKAACAGLALGVVFFGLLLFWVAFSLPGAPLTALSAYLFAVALMSLAFVLVAWLLHGAIHGARAPLWVALPLAWTAGEWLRGNIPGGLAFPWAPAALSLTGTPRLLALLPWTGEQGVTLWLALVNALVATAVLRGSSSRRAALALCAAGLAGFPIAVPAPGGEATAVGATHARVAVLQSAVPVHVRRDPVAGADAMSEVVERQLGGLRTGQVDLVVLPETAFPVELELVGMPYLDALQRHASRLGAPVLAGAFGVSDEVPTRRYNSAFVIDANGVLGRYDKRRLVPGIERTPVASARLLATLGDTTSYAIGDARPPLRIGNLSVGVLVCFESAFAGLARAHRRAGAGVLVNLTNDAWFGGGAAGTAARAQNERHLVLRAMENRVPVVRSANGGPSAVVAANGRATAVAGGGEEGIGLIELAYAGEAIPPATRIGGAVGPLAAAAAGLLLLFGARRKGASAHGA